MLWLIRRKLKSINVETRRSAAEQLCLSRDCRALEPLKDALCDPDALVRQFAATAMGRLDDDRIVEPLLKALHDSDAEVIRNAISSLKRSSDKKLVAPMVPLLRHADAGVRGSAVQALDRIGWSPGNKEDEIWRFIARTSFGRLGAFGEKAVPALEFVISSGPSSIRTRAIKVLAQIKSPRALKILLNAAKSDDINACVAALGALATLGGEDVLKPISAALRHADTRMRIAAIDALYAMRAKEASAQIRNLLKDSAWDVRLAAVETLGRFKDTESTEAMIKALEDSDGDVREMAAMALGQIGDRKAIGALVMALKDQNSSVRRIAAASLSRIDDEWSSSPAAEAGFEKLKAAIKNEDSDVQYSVTELLTGLGVIKGKTSSREAQGPRIAPSPAMLRELTITQFISMLSDSDPDFRLAAAHALGRIGDRTPQSALMRALSDPDSAVRSAVEKALERFSPSTKHN
ncbi:MAG: HEAT repeat domain-containing protein [Limisphaerales bacterium]